MTVSPEPLVTIVTVTLNCESTIAKTMDSVAQQDYQNIEYIVVDGKSNDDTPVIVGESKCVTRFVSEKDEGIYDAMNTGLRLASQESSLIHFLNAGDTFYDTAVVSNVVAQCSDSTTHLYGHLTKNGIELKSPNRLNKLSLATGMVCHQALFFRTPLHRLYQYDTQYKICADYNLLLEMIKAGEAFRMLDQVVVNFDAGGVSNQNREDLHREKKAIRRKYPMVLLYHILKKKFSNFKH